MLVLSSQTKIIYIKIVCLELKIYCKFFFNYTHIFIKYTNSFSRDCIGVCFFLSSLNFLNNNNSFFMTIKCLYTIIINNLYNKIDKPLANSSRSKLWNYPSPLLEKIIIMFTFIVNYFYLMNLKTKSS